jgi:hypothetical protein
MTFTVKAHHERYFAIFARKAMEDALAKAIELVGRMATCTFSQALGQKPTTEQSGILLAEPVSMLFSRPSERSCGFVKPLMLS